LTSNDHERQRRRLRFDEAADTYARLRPGYPDRLFDDLWDLADLRAPQVLEIGCGTGQATLSLLLRGASVFAVELGPSLANLARARRSMQTGSRSLPRISTHGPRPKVRSISR
jgi:SAM-dependent methyltransferase